jgi:predicted CopG family antitoxin
MYSEDALAKTVAVREETWEMMKKLLDAGDAKSFDELIKKLIDQSLRVPKSMFGVDKKRTVHLTLKEHEEITRDAH